MIDGTAPATPDLVLYFADLPTARAAAQGELDQLAAVGAGIVQARGLTPLAERLDVLLDRLASYLD